jgi:hypothetical protein
MRRPLPVRTQRRRLALAVAAFVLLPVGVEAQGASDPAALELLERAAERYRGIAAFCADFRQEVQNDLLRQTTRSRGELCQQRPDRFEMRFTEPSGDRVVADGTLPLRLLPVDRPRPGLPNRPRSRRGTLRPARRVPRRARSPLCAHPRGDRGRGRTRDPFWRFGRCCTRPSSGPGSGSTSDALIRKIEITETEGFVRTVELPEMRLNPTLPRPGSASRCPPGVRVVSR